METRSHQKGFTLIELVVYVAIMSALVTMVSGLYGMMGKAREKTALIAAVESQGSQAMHVITQTLRNSRVVSEPGGSVATSTLTITTYAASSTPTVFFTSSSVLYMTEGSTTVPITGSGVVVTSIAFSNHTASSTNGSVKIVLSLTSATSSKVTPYSATFYGSGTVRNQL